MIALATKFKEWKENVLPTKTENSIKNWCQRCATFQFPLNLSENAKQDTLLLHCNLPIADHLNWMTGFSFQGEEGLAGFIWGILCAKATFPERDQKEPDTWLVLLLHAPPRLLAFLYLLIITNGPFSAWPTWISSSRVGRRLPRPYCTMDQCGKCFLAQLRVPTGSRVYTLPS